MKRWAVLAGLALCAGCSTLHEAELRQRLVAARFFGRTVRLPLPELDALLARRIVDPSVKWCELCLLSAQDAGNGGRRYCVSSHEEVACVVARANGPGTLQFENPDGDQVSDQAVRALWAVVEPATEALADITDPVQLRQLAAADEAAFVPRWSFTAGAKVGSVVSYDPPSFSFGGQVGFRYWGSVFVLPGAALEVENMLQGPRSLVNAALLGRVELAVWNGSNSQLLNLPRMTFLMAAGPLVGFGATPALGGRAVMGIHLVHLGRFVTPFFFEFGFQVLEVDAQSSTGLRIALGLGL